MVSLFGLRRKELPLRLGEEEVDQRPIQAHLFGSMFGRPAPYRAMPMPRRNFPGTAIRLVLILLGVFIFFPVFIGLILLASLASSNATAALLVLPFVFIVGIILLAIAAFFIYRSFKVPGSGTYLVTTWRAMILDRTNKMMSECYLKDVTPKVGRTFDVSINQLGSAIQYTSGDVEFRSANGKLLMVFGEIDFPEQLREKIEMAQGAYLQGRIPECKSCKRPMSNANAKFCAVCGVRQF